MKHKNCTFEKYLFVKISLFVPYVQYNESEKRWGLVNTTMTKSTMKVQAVHSLFRKSSEIIQYSSKTTTNTVVTFCNCVEKSNQYIFKNVSFHVPQKKEGKMGLEQHESEQTMT